MAIAIVDIPNRLEVFTYEDYKNLPDNGKRYEIINGELYMVPAPTLGHQDTIGEFYFTIKSFLQTNPLGKIYLAPTDIVFSEIDVLQPDLIFVSKGKFDILTRENIQGAPDLVIEVLSPGTEKRDRTIKLKAYSKFGVKEYWMANDERETAEIWRRKGKKLDYHATLDRTQTLITPLLPRLEISLERIFRK
jgi:Uma2 family endonuclease